MASRDRETTRMIAEASRKAGEAAKNRDMDSEEARLEEAALIDRRLTYLSCLAEEERCNLDKFDCQRYKG